MYLRWHSQHPSCRKLVKSAKFILNLKFSFNFYKKKRKLLAYWFVYHNPISHL